MQYEKKKFPYYRKLSEAQKKIYDKSDEVEYLKLPQAKRFFTVMNDLRSALEKEDHLSIKKSASRMVNGLSEVFEVPRIEIKILKKRPSGKRWELHGLYEASSTQPTTIKVWMQTAKKKNTVAFKTFLRTVIHEFMHHLDYTHLKLKESFHTAGFYKRESSILKQMIGLIEG